MPSKGTPVRAVRVADELWDAATRKAAAEERTVGDVIRDGLTDYVETPPADLLSGRCVFCGREGGGMVEHVTDAGREIMCWDGEACTERIES